MGCATDTRLSLDGDEFPFMSIETKGSYNLTDDGENEITGFLDADVTAKTIGLQVHRFAIVLRPSPTMLDQLLPLLGFTESPTDTFTLTDTIPSFAMLIDRLEKVHTYATTYIDKWDLRGQRGDKPIELELEVLALAETEGTAFGSPTAITADIKYGLHEMAITLRSSARTADRFSLRGDHHLVPNYNNAVTASSICVPKRTITLATNVPYDSTNQALYGTPGPAGPSATGAAATLAFSRSSPAKSTSFAVTNATEIPMPPSIPHKDAEMRLNWYARCYRSGATPALVCTHDNTA